MPWDFFDEVYIKLHMQLYIYNKLLVTLFHIHIVVVHFIQS